MKLTHQCVMVLWCRPLLPVEVHELEEVCAALHGHGGAEEEEDDADAGGELPPPRPQVAGKHVDDARDQTLYDAELAVDPDRLEGI